MKGAVRVMLAAGLVLSTAAPASAQDVGLREVRAAYAEVDFQRTAELSASVIQTGGLSPTELAEAYRLLGLSSAALGQDEAARDAFVRLLAIEPGARLERSLSPALRSPYMEARGFWAQHPQRLSAQGRLVGPTLHVQVTDPGGLSAAVRVAFRADEASAYSQRTYPSGAIDTVEVGRRVEVILELLDAHNNILWRGGSDDEPLRLGPWPEDPGPSAIEPADATPWIVSGLATLAVGLGGAGVGAYFHLERERLAGVWNDADTRCGDPGLTRAEACRGVESELRQAELLTGLLYGVGAGLSIVSIVLFAQAASGDATPGASTSREQAGLHCSVLGTGAACRGWFP